MDWLLNELNRRRKRCAFLVATAFFFFATFLISIVLGDYVREGFTEIYKYIVFILLGIFIVFIILYVISHVDYQTFERRNLYPFLAQPLFRYTLTMEDKTNNQTIKLGRHGLTKVHYTLSTMIKQQTVTWASLSYTVNAGESTNELFRGMTVSIPLNNPDWVFARLESKNSPFLRSEKYRDTHVEELVWQPTLATFAPVLPEPYASLSKGLQNKVMKQHQQLLKRPQMGLLSFNNQPVKDSQLKALTKLYQQLYQLLPSPRLGIMYVNQHLWVLWNDGVDPIHNPSFKLQLTKADLQPPMKYYETMEMISVYLSEWARDLRS